MSRENIETKMKIRAFVDSLHLPVTKDHRWFSKREIRCSQEFRVDTEKVRRFVEIAQTYLGKMGLPFTFINDGENKNTTANIGAAKVNRFGRYEDVRVDPFLLSGILRVEPERYNLGHQHGDILIISPSLENMAMGHSSFDEGSVIISDSAEVRRMEYHFQNMLGANCVGDVNRDYVIQTLWETIFEKLD